MRRALLALAFLLAARDSGATQVLSDPACGVMPVVVRANTVTYPLAHTFLRAGSDSVATARRVLTRDQDYALDRARGVLRLLREPIPGETLWVHACWLLEPPPLELQRLSLKPARGIADSSAADTSAGTPFRPRPVTAHIPGEAPAGASLQINGNKTVAVDFGSNQDAFLKQSLDLAVTGALAPGVELAGVLSDRNTSLSPTGSTQDLQSIDRLLLELRTPHGGAQLGDIVLRLEQGEFAQLDRRVQGVGGRWDFGAFKAEAAATSAQGQYRRLEFFGVEGQQGPYTLTDASGTGGITVVTGTEVVTLDGERLGRGESADYAIDYDRGRITFTSRRPISSASRIAVEYQYALTSYHRNLALASAGWRRAGWTLATSWMNESDDRGRPVSGTLDPSDVLVLSAAGDSASQAIGAGVTAGGGDYVLVQGGGGPYYAFAGPDSGGYVVRFTAVGLGRGDYSDSALVLGRTIYRFVGAGNGAYVIGKQLPLPSAHQLLGLRGRYGAGPLSLQFDGAMSRFDANSQSNLDDQDNVGPALDGRLALEGRVERLAGRAGIELSGRSVDRRFVPFGRLERAFEAERWGLPAGVDLDHQRRAEASAFVAPGHAGEFRIGGGVLETPDAFRSLRRDASWALAGPLAARASWDRADGTQDGRVYPDGGRDLRLASLAARSRWCEPALRASWDERWSPSDSARVGARAREVAGEIGSPRSLAWRGLVGAGWRRDGQALDQGFADQTETRSVRMALTSPASAAVGGGLTATRRDQRTLADDTRLRSDLASLLMRGTDARRGLGGQYGLEITNEAQSERSRVLAFVGAGQGSYDSLGNFVGNGSYDLVPVTNGPLQRVARVASSLRASWTFGAGDAWRGSRVEFVFESDARRRGDLKASDIVLSPAAALGDTALARGSVLQRLETELAPGSALASLKVRLERRVSADRSFANIDQSQEQRLASGRWRARAGAAWTAEVEGRLRRQTATQTLVSTGASSRRSLGELGTTGQLVFTPEARVRAVWFVDLAWSRPEAPDGSALASTTRTLRTGPDLGLGVGARGHVDLTLRRAFVSGPALPSLLPGADPLTPPRWESTARADYRLFEVATVGLSFVYQERNGLPTQVNGRAEVRAFF